MSSMSRVETEDTVTSKTQFSMAFRDKSISEEEVATIERLPTPKTPKRVDRIQAKMSMLWKKMT